MMAAGFPPDTISSDVHKLCIDGPVYDQVTTLSKFLALGMPLRRGDRSLDRQCRRGAAAAGTRLLRPGSVGDASILEMRSGSFDLEDVLGEVVTTDERLFAAGVVIGGRWWHPE